MTADQWFAKAVREPGHTWAHGYPGEQEPGHKAGAVYHSAEGSLATMRAIIARAGEPSWIFSNPKTGRLIQHYGVGTHAWANGSLNANVRYVSCESEGVAGEPLTASQVQNLVDLTRWLKKRFGWTGVARGVELFEHNELAQTACPSGRIPWDRIIADLQEEEDMADNEVRSRLAVQALFLQAAAYAAEGKALPKALADQIHYLLHAG